MSYAADWYSDPTGQHEHRYWDGTAWTEHVSDGGVPSTAALASPGVEILIDDDGSWTGMTRLGGGIESTARRLYNPRNPTAQALRELVMERGHVPDRRRWSLDDDVIHGEATGPSFRGRHYSGWNYTAPQPPRAISPLPLELPLLLGHEECPLEELAPWWNQIQPRSTAAASPIVRLDGTTVEIGKRNPLSWSRGELTNSAEAGSMLAYDDRLEFYVSAKIVTQDREGPGFVGGLIPVYSQMKTLSAAASQQNHRLQFGAAAPLSSISHVSLYFEHYVNMPLVGKEIKELTQRRGYGIPKLAELAVEFTDGWHPWRAAFHFSFKGAEQALQVESSRYRDAPLAGSSHRPLPARRSWDHRRRTARAAVSRRRPGTHR